MRLKSHMGIEGGTVERKDGPAPWRWWRPWLWTWKGETGAMWGTAWTFKSARRQQAAAVYVVEMLREDRV
jgi:hypothetical protein